jgi:hypothetical protein
MNLKISFFLINGQLNLDYLQLIMKPTIKSMEMAVKDVKTAKAVNQKNSLLSMTLIFSN